MIKALGSLLFVVLAVSGCASSTGHPKSAGNRYDINSLKPLVSKHKPSTSPISAELDKFTSPESAPPATAALVPGQMRIHLIDVGQGAATLLEFTCAAVLIDTGGETSGRFNSGDALQNYLEAFFEQRSDLNRTLALLVLSHPHIDHARNVKLVTDNYSVQNVLTDAQTDDSGSGGRQQKSLQNWAKSAGVGFERIDAAHIASGGTTSSVIDPVNCHDVDPAFRVLWGGAVSQPNGWSDDDFENKNNHSVVLRVDFGKASLLFSGDLEEAGIASLLEKHRGTRALDVDLWQVGHHGAANATTQALLDALTPHLTLIATGDPSRHQMWTAWKYGHPRKTTVDLLTHAVQLPREEKDVEVALGVEDFDVVSLKRAIYATGWDGDVLIEVGSDGSYAASTER